MVRIENAEHPRTAQQMSKYTPPCNIAGATPSGVVTRACGCVEQLYYEQPNFGEPGGWGARSWGEHTYLSRCDVHSYEQKTRDASKAAALAVFAEHFGMTVEAARDRIVELRNEKVAIDKEIARLTSALTDISKY